MYELTREIGEEALSQAIKHLERLTVFAEKLYNAVAKLKKAALTGGVPSDEGEKPDKDSQERKPDSSGPPLAAEDRTK